jgi:glycosyltransferase involved in cell wall biosynthesis
MKLSVITVTWNAEKTVERTLKSVQEQTYSHMEHLIVDGASVDGTLKIIQEYSEGDLNIQKEGSILNRITVQKRLKWVSEPDQGLYDAMNKAIGMASGDYLCFLNAGDTFYARIQWKE